MSPNHSPSTQEGGSRGAPDLAGCKGGQAAQGLPLSVDYEPGLLGVVCMGALGVVCAIPGVRPHIDGLCAGCKRRFMFNNQISAARKSLSEMWDFDFG